MKAIKQILTFILLIAAVLAIIGGTAYLFYDHHALFGVANILLAGLAFPTIKQLFNDLLNK